MNKSRFYLFLINTITIFWFNFGVVEGIIGGDVAKHGQFKYQAALLSDHSFICGAIIIDDLFALTAAHCLLQTNLKFITTQLSILGGIIHIEEQSSTRIEVDVKKVYIPAKYAFDEKSIHDDEINTGGDIAVLRLEHPLGLNKNDALGKVKLPQTSESLSTYEYMDPIVTGFGYSKATESKGIFGGKKLSLSYDGGFKLKYAEAVVIPNEKCQRSFINTIFPRHLCARLKTQYPDKPENTCKGDSGGALVFDGTIIGILSGCSGLYNQQGLASVFTKVGYFLSFINEAKRDKPSPNTRWAAYEIKSGLLGSKKKVLVEPNSKNHIKKENKNVTVHYGPNLI